MRGVLHSLALILALACSAPVMGQQTGKALQEFVVPADAHVTEVVLGALTEITVTAPHLADDRPWRAWLSVPDADQPVEILDLSGRLKQRIPARDARAGAWTRYFDSRDVYFTAPGEAEVRIISWREIAIMTQTPVNGLNLVPVKGHSMDLDLQDLTRAVGFLSIHYGDTDETDGAPKRFVHCTTFMISTTIAVTAAHCVEYGLDGKFAELVLGYTDLGKPNGAGRFGVRLAHMSRTHDLAFLELDRPADVPAVFTIADTAPVPGQELLVLQHYGAEAMSISDDDDCRLTDGVFDGRLINDKGKIVPRIKDLAWGHGCDTTKSSSGSPVLDRDTLEVVLVHQRGYDDRDGTVKPENRGINTHELAILVTDVLERRGG
ncbi:serine protease [Roseovarius sp. M141]|uniref:trypsin-like serine peptidase n=1 Tax=Roseovarius sp. M141 TaxID=2583806 RepID=UPI0020CB7BE6|nr:serine protease [Roseovarius sp. M141]MCQ0093421.1 trypsin-like peptidase domain-containing protein [Roseovarius sp. M141]